MEIPGQIGENVKVKLNKKFLTVLLLLVPLSASAGNIDWSIHFDWILPPPSHGHGHGHGHGSGWNNNHNYVNCASYYMSHGCNQYGYNCIQMPHSECKRGKFVGPYRPRHVDHHGTMHNHTWRCYQRHWHGHDSHQHHADGHHSHDPHMMWNK